MMSTCLPLSVARGSAHMTSSPGGWGFQMMTIDDDARGRGCSANDDVITEIQNFW